MNPLPMLKALYGKLKHLWALIDNAEQIEANRRSLTAATADLTAKREELEDVLAAKREEIRNDIGANERRIANMQGQIDVITRYLFGPKGPGAGEESA